MVVRIAMLAVAFSIMGAGGFTLGRSSVTSGQADEFGVPKDHPVVVALAMRTELKLSFSQTARLEDIKNALARKLEPFGRRAKEIENMARRVQQLGSDPQAKSRLEADMKGLRQTIEVQVPPLMEKAAEEVVQTLDQSQRESLQRILQAKMAKSGSDDLVLTFIMEHREQLGISPQQFTKLQYLQADLIRAFAPIREQVELLQIEMRRTVEQTQKEPPTESVQTMKSFEERVAKLKEQISNRAIEEVLNPEQRQKLHELLRGRSKSPSAR